MSTRRGTDDVLAAPAARREARALSLTWFVSRCFFLLLVLVGALVTFFTAVGAYQVVSTGLDLLSSESSTNWTTFGNFGIDASGDAELVKPLISTHDRFDVAVTLWLDANRPEPSLHVEAAEQAAVVKVEGRGELHSEVNPHNRGATSDTWSEAAVINTTREAKETRLWSRMLFFNRTLASPISHAEVPVHIAKDLLSSWNATHGWLRASFSILPHTLYAQGGPLELLSGYSLPRSRGPKLDVAALADRGDLMSLSDLSAPLTLRNYPNGRMSGRSQTYLKRRLRIGIISDQVDIPRLALLERRRQLEQQVLECKVERAKPAGNIAGKCQRAIKDFPAEAELSVRNTSTADAQLQHRWAPRLLYSSLGHSSSELLPVMDHRNDTDADAIEKDINFAWKISFGSVTAKQAWMDIKIEPHVISPNNFISSTFSKVSGHVVHKAIASVMGDQRHPRSKPWRRLMLYAFSHASGLLSYLLTTAYWYTRATTAGVSIMGCYLRGAVLLAPAGLIFDATSFWDGVFRVLVCILILFGELLALWTALRLQLSWRGVLPVLRQLPALKAERDSRRLEARRTNWTLNGLLFASICAFRYFGNAKYLVAGSGAGRDTVRVNLDSRTKFIEWYAMNIVLESLVHLGAVFQLAHNARCRTFAGDMRLASHLMFLSRVSVVLHRHVSFVRGWGEHYDPFPVTELISLAISTAYAWQAWNLPAVSQKISEDDDVVAL